MKAYELYEMVNTGTRDRDGYDIEYKRTIGYYINEEILERNKRKYLKWNPYTNPDRLKTNEIDIEED